MRANSKSFDVHRKRVSAVTDFPTTISAAPTAPEPHDQPSSQLHCVLSSSSCGDDEGHATDQACPSYFPCSSCSEVLHELANVMTGVLANAQMLGWKLPPYSHLKRPVREVERSAQRGGELLKRLINRCAQREPLGQVQP